MVRAGGTGTVSQPPQFEVIVDGVSLGIRSVTNPLATFNVNNDANFQNYSFSFDGPAPNSVDIRYLNNGTEQRHRSKPLHRLHHAERDEARS